MAICFNCITVNDVYCYSVSVQGTADQKIHGKSETVCKDVQEDKMSIQKQYREYVLICDICQNEVDGTFVNFIEAVDYKKENGWKSKKEGGGWIDICPDCQE